MFLPTDIFRSFKLNQSAAMDARQVQPVTSMLSIAPAVQTDPSVSKSPKFQARVLTSGDLDQARNLLYKVYYIEKGWRPEKDNPSELRVEIGSFGPMLVDKYDHDSIWFGCFAGERLVAVHRSYHSESGRFEMSEYFPTPKVFSEHFSVEFTRLAICENYRTNSPVFVVLLATEFAYLRTKGVRFVFCSAGFPSPGDLYLKAGMKLYDSKPFKYYPSEPIEVSIIYYDFSEPEALDRLIRLAERNQKSNLIGNT